jgi:predicted dehydrogenase
MERLKWGLIGAGDIARRRIAPALHDLPDCELVSVSRSRSNLAESFAKEFGVRKWFADWRDLIADDEIDAVYIATPVFLHAEQAIAAADAGKHVLCEKPMALTVHECGEMIKAAERYNKRLFAIKQNRFNPPVEAVKNIMDEGRLGKIYSVQLSCFWNRNPDYYKNSWKGTLKLDGGTLFTQFSHFIDLLYWMIGDVKQVHAYMGNYAHQGIIEFEDTGVVILEFYNGAIGTVNYTVNSFQKNMEGSLTIFGEKGTVKIGGQYLNELEYQNIEGYKIENLPEGNRPNNYGTYQGSMSNHDKVYDNLIEVLQNNAAISTSSFEGLKTVEIIEKIYKAAVKV